MKKYRYSGDLSTIHDIDTLFSVFLPVIDGIFTDEVPELCIDLSNVRFVSPIGAISLLQLLKKLDSSFILKLDPPMNNGNLLSYLSRIDFFNHCPEGVRNSFNDFCNLEQLSSRNRNDTSKILLEIKKLLTEEDVGEVFDATLNILSSHGMQSKFANRIAIIVSELTANVIDHSKGEGFVCIQYYPKTNKVNIGIGDNGIGIVNSLGPHLRKELMGSHSHLEVIKLAFEEGITSIADEERGVGLTDVREKSFLGTKGTSFYLRTHRGIY